MQSTSLATFGIHPGGGGIFWLTSICWVPEWKTSKNSQIAPPVQQPIYPLKFKTWYRDKIDPIAVEKIKPWGIVAEKENCFVCPFPTGEGITNKGWSPRMCFLTAPPDDIFHLISWKLMWQLVTSYFPPELSITPVTLITSPDLTKFLSQVIKILMIP